MGSATPPSMRYIFRAKILIPSARVTYGLLEKTTVGQIDLTRRVTYLKQTASREKRD